MARLNISLTNEMAKKIQDSADEDGKTISSVITESVDLYLHLKEMGISRSQLIRFVRFLEVTKSINAVPVPSLLLDTTLSMSLTSSQEKVTEAWCEAGRITGEFFKTVVPDIDKLSQEFKEYSIFSPLTKMELKKEGNEVELLLIGTGYSIGAAKVTAEAIKCFLKVYGVSDFKTSTSEGFVMVKGLVGKGERFVDEE